MPLVGKSESFGVLQLLKTQSDAPVAIAAEMRELAVTVALRIAIAFANLKLSESLRDQSVRDPLTHLFNRRYMTETLERELHRARRDQGSPVCLVLLDLDHFKQVNDTYGLGAGDAVLLEFAAILIQHSRQSDVACRLGGEEFVLVLPDCPIEAAQRRAEQILSTVRRISWAHKGQELGPITVSAGVASCLDSASDAGSLLQAADKALYRAKDAGRDRVEVACDPV